MVDFSALSKNLRQGTMACVSDPDGKVTWKAGPGISVERDLQVYGLIG